LHFATKDVIEFNDYKGHWPEFVAKKIVLPHSEHCSLFGELAKPVERQKYKLERQIAQLKKQRDLVLPKLISGTTSLSDVEVAA
jgi:type I restriction enzyme S subunit